MKTLTFISTQSDPSVAVARSKGNVYLTHSSMKTTAFGAALQRLKELQSSGRANTQFN